MTAVSNNYCSVCNINIDKYPNKKLSAFGGKLYCGFRCFNEEKTSKKKTVIKVCCICNRALLKPEKFTVKKGFICSNDCFHTWLNEGYISYAARELEKIAKQIQKDMQ